MVSVINCALVYTLDLSHNALWAMGEIAIALSPEKKLNDVPAFLAPFLEEILKRAFYILTSPEADCLTGTSPR